jgi:hypothetical protein
LDARERWLVKLPFSVYFGWITVATIANITILLVSWQWNGFGLSDQLWTVIILLVGAVIGSWRMLKDNSPAYGLVFVWAYWGIYLKHTTDGASGGWANEYPTVIATSLICMVGLASVVLITLVKNRRLSQKATCNT